MRGRFLVLVCALLQCRKSDDGGPPTPAPDVGASDSADASDSAIDAGVQRVGTGAPGTFQAETAIAARDAYVVVAYMDQKPTSLIGAVNPARIRLAISSDRGKSFAPPIEVGEGDFDRFDPTVVVLPGGKTSVGWFEDDGKGARHVRVADASSPSGPYTLAPPLDTGSGFVDRPWIAASSDGTLYAMWVEAPTHVIVVARRSPGGSFEIVQRSPDGGLFPGRVVVEKDGAVSACVNAWDGAYKDDPAILVSRSTDSGKTFTPKLLARLGRPGRVIVGCAPRPTGGVAAVWPKRTGTDVLTSADVFDADLYYATTADGAAWTSPTKLPAPSGAIPVSTPPDVAATPDGRLHVLFHARRSGGASSDDGWATFIAKIDPAGAVDIVRVSSTTWPGLRLSSITPPKVDMARWLGDTIALDTTNGSVFAAFAENRDGDADVFAATFAP